MSRIIGVTLGLVMTACLVPWLQPPWYGAFGLGILMGMLADTWVNTWRSRV